VVSILDDRLLNIKSRHLSLRPATEADVPLIFDLRRSERGQFLNPTSPDIAQQYEYFERYSERFEAGDEIYYVVEDNHTCSECGIFRLTRITNAPKIGWEGLILNQSASPMAGIDICATVYEVAIVMLGRTELGPWAIKPSNRPMLQIHKYMGTAFQVGQDAETLWYSVKSDEYLKRREWLQCRGFGVINDE
jgi:hypothetical protein